MAPCLESQEQMAATHLTISGATGNNALIINGLYVLQEETFNGRPLWQKAQDAQKWLAYMPNEQWYVTQSSCKERNSPGGWLKAQGALPTDVAQWSLLNGGFWVSDAAIVVKEVANAPPTPRKEAVVCTDVAALKTSVPRSPVMRTMTICSASGAFTLAAAGGAFGGVSGFFVGASIGVVPAVVTLGASIPFGAVVGAMSGACAGICAGSALGATIGLAAGSTYVWRAELKNGVVHIRVAAVQRRDVLGLRLTSARQASMQEVAKLAEKGKRVLSNRRVQVTAASAAAGATVCGTTGGAAGAVTGAGVGVLVGLPAALFTLGLSVPICAVVGGSVGCAAGASSGAAAGGAVFGAAGYNAHKYQHTLVSGKERLVNRLTGMRQS